MDTKELYEIGSMIQIILGFRRPDFFDYKPIFAHISLIHNERNEKLSKRDNASSILEFKDKGYLPEAINNYLLRMGWSHGDKEFFSIQEAEKIFTL